MDAVDKKIEIGFIEEWSQVFGGHNWYTVTPLKFEIEVDPKMGTLDCWAIIAGIGFSVHWLFNDKTEMRRRIAADVAAIAAELKTDEGLGHKEPLRRPLATGEEIGF